MNKSLKSFAFPPMEINARNGLMAVLVLRGLICNRTIRTIDFSACDLNQVALSFLEEMLVESPGTLSASSVHLPIVHTQAGLKPFLRSLARMPLIQTVSIRGSLDAASKKLLLEAVQEKKTLRFFERGTADDSSNDDPIDAQIDFYLNCGMSQCSYQLLATPFEPHGEDRTTPGAGCIVLLCP
jgi:hypothetical protein